MRISGSYSAHFALPVVFALYIATSASRIIDDAVHETSPTAIPMLADSTIGWAPTMNGAVSDCSTRSATVSASSSTRVLSSMRIANSSPPMRDTVSRFARRW